MDLSGQWRFEIDRGDVGVAEEWFNRTLADELHLPGSLQAQDRGDEVTVDTKWVGTIADRSWYTDAEYARFREPGNLKIPFWLQPERHYMGAAWYQKDVEVPADWAGRRIVLFLERAHWETTLYVDGRRVGSNRSLSTPHEYDLGLSLTPGRHRFTLRVDNRVVVPVGINAHSISDHTQTNWNGVIGAIELRAGSPVWLDDVQCYWNAKSQRAQLTVVITNCTGRSGSGRLIVGDVAHAVKWDEQGERLTIEHSFGDGAATWDEFNPALHRLTLRLESAHGIDEKSQSVGLREISTIGTQLAINGRPIFLRGTLECCVFPRTGYPPTDVESWRRVYTACQSHGLNHVRFHSWCPPEAAFVAADEMGVYLQVECATWPNGDTNVGIGNGLDEWLYAEATSILRYYGNHPSFIMMAAGNEPVWPSDEPWFAKWINHWKQHDPRHVYTACAGWPHIDENDYQNPPHPQRNTRQRISDFPPETKSDHSSLVARQRRPIVCHEIGQWCVYPDLREIPKYDGLLKAKNFEIFRQTLAEHHMGDLAEAFLHASGKLQALCYKEEVETNLRTPGMGGYHLLGLNDFPGQGTALVGVLNAFWESKGYIRADEFRGFSGPTVLLARMPRRVWTSHQTFETEIEIAHFGAAPIEAKPVWRLLDDTGTAVISGALPMQKIPVGNGTLLGAIHVKLRDLPAAKKYKLVVGLEGHDVENDWDVWVFPESQPSDAGDVFITSALSEAAIKRLAEGGTVLLLARPDGTGGDIKLGFPSIFWNTAWFPNSPCRTLGLLCDPAHPVFNEFPTDSHSNWQWWELFQDAAALIIDDLPTKADPLVRVIDDWFTNRRLALVQELTVGGGRLVVCGIDLENALERRPVARQFRASLLKYMNSPSFAPKVGVELSAVQRCLLTSATRHGASV